MVQRKSNPIPKNRGEVDMDEFTVMAAALLSTPENQTPSENREPTKAEIEQKWVLRRAKK